MDPDIKQKIDALLHELRTWEQDEARYTVQELADMFNLTTFVVARIAAAEDVEVPSSPEPIDPDAVTKPVETGMDVAADTTPTGVFHKDDLDLGDD